MITGDNPLTAVHVAKDVEIVDREVMILDLKEGTTTDGMSYLHTVFCADIQNSYGEMSRKPNSSPSTLPNRSTRPFSTNTISVSPGLRSSNMKGGHHGRFW
jgi:magnesium-transporting ATPase (P-type)